MHDIILILIPSRWFNSFVWSLFIISYSRFYVVHLVFRSSKLFQLYHFKAPSNSPQALNLILFIFHFSCFHYRSFHGGSSCFNSSSKSSSRFLLELKHSSSCIPIAILSTLSFQMVLCHSWQFPSCFMIHKLLGMRCLNPSFSLFRRSFQPFILSVGVILGYNSPKTFP